MAELSLNGSTLIVRGQLSRGELDCVRGLAASERRFDAKLGCWLVKWTTDNQTTLSLVFDVSQLPSPTDASYRIHAGEGMLWVQTPYSATNVELLRNVPDHRAWEPKAKAWRCRPTGRTLEYLKRVFPQAQWTSEAQALYTRTVEEEASRIAQLRFEKEQVLADVDATPDDYQFGGPHPFIHQRRAFLLSRARPYFALLMEQGTGKSKVVVDTACWLYQQGLIDRVLVVAPNSVKTNWVTDEIPIHSSPGVKYRACYWSGSGGNKEQKAHLQSVINDTSGALLWFCINVEALSTGGAGEEAATRFLRGGRALMDVDESSKIKAPGAQRTRAVLRLGKLAPYRRINTGTPITQGPIDAFSQFFFLDPSVLGFGSATAFKKHHVEYGGYNDRVIVGYKHVDELQERIKPHSFRVLREDCLDLPPKIHQKLKVELAPQQRKIYEQMLNEMRAELAGVGHVTTTMVMTQYLRLQQITGGFIPLEKIEVADNGVPVVVGTKVEPIPGPNPKIDALLELAEETGGKMIIWARFRPEIDLVARRLREVYGNDAVVEFHGGVNDEQRIRARVGFQDPTSPVRFFVGQTETGGMGLTLTQARTVVYYSNSFSYEARTQSEDRAHRIGQTGSVTYVDIVAIDTKDEAIMEVVRTKRNLANAVTGDKWKEWI